MIGRRGLSRDTIVRLVLIKTITVDFALDGGGANLQRPFEESRAYFHGFVCLFDGADSNFFLPRLRLQAV
jgi:hypothetical protein